MNFKRTFFSHSTSEQFSKQNTIVNQTLGKKRHKKSLSIVVQKKVLNVRHITAKHHIMIVARGTISFNSSTRGPFINYVNRKGGLVVKKVNFYKIESEKKVIFLRMSPKLVRTYQSIVENKRTTMAPLILRLTS